MAKRKMPRAAAKALDEHSVLLMKLARVEALLERTRHRPGADLLTAEELLPGLKDLYRTVELHFAGEERTILSNRRMREFPRASRRIASFRRDHARIRVVFRAVMAASEVYREEDHALSPRLIQWVRGGVLERLRRHEEAETTFFQELVYLDMGQGD